MALFGIKMKKRRAASHGSYHNNIEQSNSFFRRNTQTRKSLGLVRSIFSGLSLSFGGMMCYVALHYLPAYIHPQKILNSNSIDTSVTRLHDKGPIRKVFGPYIDALSMQRTYLRNGQQIEAQFILPEGASLALDIQQCRRVLALEVFKCDVISQKTVTITNKTIGDKAFQFADKGFYHFNHHVTFADDTPSDYKVVWVRL